VAQHITFAIFAKLCRVAAGGPRDAELLASLRIMVDSLTEELRLVDPAAKWQRMDNGAGSFKAGEHIRSKAVDVQQPVTNGWPSIRQQQLSCCASKAHAVSQLKVR
jgi:hypothetical protein